MWELNFWIIWCPGEKGIRDAQESRGLGDVYKRQEKGRVFQFTFVIHFAKVSGYDESIKRKDDQWPNKTTEKNKAEAKP